jgi:hypothetical protein
MTRKLLTRRGLLSATSAGLVLPVQAQQARSSSGSSLLPPASVQAPFSVHLGTYLGDGGGTKGSIARHWSDVKSEIASPTILSVVMINSHLDGNALPSQWGGDYRTWTAGNGLPVDGSVVPHLDAHMTNGTSTDCDYAGVIAGTYDAALQNALNLWKGVAPFKKMYQRINWEFKTNFRDWGVPASGQVSQWVAAYKHWCNVSHTWGNNNGIDMRMVWCPDTSYKQAASATFSLSVINFFPQPDGSAVGGRYIDVIGSDNYMNGYGVSGVSGLGQGFTTPLASNTIWSLGTFIAMAQAYRCNIGLSEIGDGAVFDKNASCTNGVMAGWATFLNTLSRLSPAVPIEYISLFDVSAGGASQCTGGNFPAMSQGWNCALGNAAKQPNPSIVIPKIMTIAPI